MNSTDMEQDVGGNPHPIKKVKQILSEQKRLKHKNKVKIDMARDKRNAQRREKIKEITLKYSSGCIS